MANQDTNRDININVYDEDPFSFTLNENTIEARIVAVRSGGGSGGSEVWVNGTGINSVKTIDATTASGDYSVAEGYATTASGGCSHAEGQSTEAYGDFAHAEGVSTEAGNYSHAEGYGTYAGEYSHAEGYYTNTDHGSHVEGWYTTAYGDCSHGEGYESSASGNVSHSEGLMTESVGDNSHAEGSYCISNGNSSHAEGYDTVADSEASHASGYNTYANAFAMTAVGMNNKGATIVNDDWTANTQYSIGDIVVFTSKNSDDFPVKYTYKCITANSDSTFNSSKWELLHVSDGDIAFAVGNGVGGAGASGRSNAMSVYWNGDAEFSGKVTVGANPSNNMDVATKQYVDNAVSGAGGDCLWDEGTGTNSVMMKAATGASGNNSIAEGTGTTASGNYSHAEGMGSTAGSESSHAEGTNTVAQNINAHAEGGGSRAYGVSSHAEGSGTNAYGNYSHTEGGGTTTGVSAGTTTGEYSHAEGSSTTSTGTGSHSEGGGSSANGNFSHAEGSSTTANAVASHAEGNGTRATGNQSHAEGSGCIASGNQSHAEGGATTASANQAHSEGASTNASGISSHAEGVSTRASGVCSHSEGALSVASGDSSHASGYGTIANCDNMTAIGAYNVGATLNAAWVKNTSYNVGDIISRDGITYKCITANSDSTFDTSKWELLYRSTGDTAFVIGNGVDSSNAQRSNAMRVDWYGNTEIGGKLTVGSAPTNNMDVATKQYVDNAVSGGGASSDDDIINTVNGSYVTIADVKEDDTPITCLVDIECTTSGTPNWTTPIDIYGVSGTKIYHHGVECCPRYITIATDSNGDWQTDVFAGVKSGVTYVFMFFNPTNVTNDVSVCLKHRETGVETNTVITTFTPVASNATSVVFIPTKNGEIYLSGSFGSSYADRTFSPVAYMNIDKLKSPHSEYEAKIYTPFDWSSAAGIIYGGELNVLTGELSVTKNLITLDGTISPDSIVDHTSESTPCVEAIYNANNSIFTKTPLASRHYIISDRIKSVSYIYTYNYDQNAYIDNNGALHVGLISTTATIENVNNIFASKPTKIVYKVAEPTVYNLTPTNIEFLEDYNIIFSEFGDITIVYQANVKKYIDERIGVKIEENNNTYGIQYFSVSGISETVAAGDTCTIQYSLTTNQINQIKNGDYFILVSQDNKTGALDFVKVNSNIGRSGGGGGGISYYRSVNDVTKNDNVFSMSFDIVLKNTTNASVTITNGSVNIGFLRKIIVRVV